MSEKQTYSSAMMVSHDGVDEDGVRAEVGVVVGYGDVSEVIKKTQAICPNFTVSNTKFGIKGWVKKDSEVAKMINKAYAEDKPIYFRVEKARKKGIDRTIPIQELSKGMENARDHINNQLAAVRWNEEDDWTFSDDALTNPAEDPIGSRSRPSALSMSAEDLKNSRPAATGNTGNNSFVSHYNTSNCFEAPQYMNTNNDGEFNLGSLGAKTPALVRKYLLDYCKKNDIDASDDQINRVSVAFVSIANKAQVLVYKKVQGKDIEADMNAPSHSTARSLLYDFCEFSNPLTVEEFSDDAALNAWAKSALKSVLTVWIWSVKEAKKIQMPDKVSRDEDEAESGE